MGFWNNLFGRGRKAEPSYRDRLNWVGWDIHNHLLPGIDDGSPDVDESLKLIRGLKELGIHNAVATPHVMAGVHNNTPESIKAAHGELTAALRSGGIDFKLKYSAEYMIDDQIEEWIGSDRLCLIADKFMLIEMSYLSESRALFNIIKEIQDRGYQPVLAHPERYNYYHNNFKIFQEIKSSGCMLQLNLLSISKYYGENVKTCALTLIRAGMYDFVGTDMHHSRHLEALKAVVSKYDVRELLKGCPIKNSSLGESLREKRTA